MELGLAGARVLVAGVGGLGRACARAFLESGAQVVIADARSDCLLEAKADFGADGFRIQEIAEDLTSERLCVDAVDRAVETMGGLDVLVHAIGVNVRTPVLDNSEDDWQRILTVNLSTAYWLGRAAGRVMCEAGSGRILFVSSVSSLMPHDGHGAYAASKGGLNQLMRVMALEWAPHGVTVNAVAPSYVVTPLTKPYLSRAEVGAAELSMVPLGRFGVPDDIAGPVLFLASDLASYVTGHVLVIDGGRTLV